jgi:sn-2 palmitoyl-lipid 9-desaturase
MKNITTMSGPLILSIQYASLLISIIGAFFVPWTFGWILTAILFFYLYNAIGMSMMLHRYFSHKAFKFKSPILKWIFIGISVISSRGSPIAWVHIHREHHAYADTDKDPHKPDKFSLFSFKTTYIKELKLFLIKDILNKEQKFIHEYYLWFILGWCSILFLINPYLIYFAWALPVCLNQITQDLWNYFSHVNVGYRRFNTKDNSRNVVWLWPFVLGEAWHNNHHDMPTISTTAKKWEFDPIRHVINLVS